MDVTHQRARVLGAARPGAGGRGSWGWGPEVGRTCPGRSLPQSWQLPRGTLGTAQLHPLTHGPSRCHLRRAARGLGRLCRALLEGPGCPPCWWSGGRLSAQSPALGPLVPLRQRGGAAPAPAGQHQMRLVGAPGFATHWLCDCRPATLPPCALGWMLPPGMGAAASMMGTGAECELSWAEPGWQEGSRKPILVSVPLQVPSDCPLALPGLARQQPPLGSEKAWAESRAQLGTGQGLPAGQWLRSRKKAP